MSELQKKMLRIIFINFLDVLNFIMCMFSGTVDEIKPHEIVPIFFPTNKN